MAENTMERSLAKPTEFRIGNNVIDLYPIRVKDWPEASKFMYILNFESLADIAYVNALDGLDSLIRIVARSDELDDTSHLGCLAEVVNDDYKWFRQVVTAQNDIDMDRLLKKVAQVAGGSKNVETSPSL